MDKRKVIKNIVSYLLVIAGGILAFYPFFSNFYNEKQMEKSSKQYEYQIRQYSDEQKEKMLRKAREYNRVLSQSKAVLTDPFDAQSYEMEKGKEVLLHQYNDILAISEKKQEKVMGYIEIPCIDVNLPILHGCKEETLLQGVGHLEGSSLPVGGKSTHCILSGHTGLNQSKMFTDLHELEKGDLFYLHILGKEYVYKVDQIKVVWPEDINDLLIVPNKDFVTLVTCTPYGINDHRLLVRGIRTQKPKEVKKQQRKESLWMKNYKKYMSWGIGMMMVICSINMLRKRLN